METQTEYNPSRPLVRYHGGKWRIAPWIIRHFPAHRCYVEPFGGGGSVLLRKERAYAEVYNDLDGEIVNLFRVARDHGPDLSWAVYCTPFSREEFNAAYEPTDDPIERARRTMIRCGMGFSSTGINAVHKTGFRGSATRTGTHPALDWKNQESSLRLVIERLRGVVIENRDALEVMRYHDSESTLHYVDPPYVHSSRSWLGGKGAYKHEMTDDQHLDLISALEELKGAVVLSSYPSDLYENRLANSQWLCVTRMTKADKARPRQELLWMRNFKPEPDDLFDLADESTPFDDEQTA